MQVRLSSGWSGAEILSGAMALSGKGSEDCCGTRREVRVRLRGRARWTCRRPIVACRLGAGSAGGGQVIGLPMYAASSALGTRSSRPTRRHGIPCSPPVVSTPGPAVGQGPTDPQDRGCLLDGQQVREISHPHLTCSSSHQRDREGTTALTHVVNDRTIMLRYGPRHERHSEVRHPPRHDPQPDRRPQRHQGPSAARLDPGAGRRGPGP